MDGRRKVLRRRPLSDCSNVSRKSASRDSADGAFEVKKSLEGSTAEDVKLGSSVSGDMGKKRSPGERKCGAGFGKENVDGMGRGKEEDAGLDCESSLFSTPPVKKLNLHFATGSVTVDPKTTYTRRRVSKKIFGSSSFPPELNKRNKLFNEDGQSMSKWHTEPSKKKRSLPGDLISQDFIERQRAYFQEIDKLELAEEEVSESE